MINAVQGTPIEGYGVVIAYDDSDGWYDHQMPPVVNQSSSSSDALTTTATTVSGVTTVTLSCGNGATALPGNEGRSCLGPLWLQCCSPASVGDLSVGQGKLRGSHADGSDLGVAIHRG